MMSRRFFYDTGEKKVGPVTGNDLVRLRAGGEIADDTWVRREDSSTWRPLSQIDLSAEEEQEAHPTLWQILTRHFSWCGLLLLAAVLVVVIAIGVGLLMYAWPVVLVLLLGYMFFSLLSKS